MRGEVFVMSPIELQSRCKSVPNEPIPRNGHSSPSTPECSFQFGHRQSRKQRRHCEARVIYNVTPGIHTRRGVSRHLSVSDASDGARPL